jgi:hypothetical protein
MVRRLYVELGKDLPLVNSFGMAPDKLCSDNGRWHYSPSRSWPGKEFWRFRRWEEYLGQGRCWWALQMRSS